MLSVSCLTRGGLSPATRLQSYNFFANLMQFTCKIAIIPCKFDAIAAECAKKLRFMENNS